MINLSTDNVEELELADKVVAAEKFEALELLLDENTEAGKAFKVLILDGYLKDEAARTTSLLAEPSMQQYRPQLFEGLTGISQFEQYLKVTQVLGAPETDESDEE